MKWTFFLFVLFLSGCASYRANDLSALDPYTVRSYSEMEGLHIGCKAFTEADCLVYLDRNVIAKGYQPIQLTFQNMSDKTYIFSSKEMSIPCTNTEEVAQSVYTSTFGRVVAYSLLVLPAIVDGIRSAHANTDLNQDFHEKAREHFVIPPGAYQKTIVFVPRAHYRPVFDLSLLEQETGKHKTVGLSLVSFSQ
jgi:hypothetical protein